MKLAKLLVVERMVVVGCVSDADVDVDVDGNEGGRWSWWEVKEKATLRCCLYR